MHMLAEFVQKPYRIATRFMLYRALGVAASLALMTASVLGFGAMGLAGARAIWRDQGIWNEGGPGLPAQVKGEVTTRQFVLKSYKLEVSYVSPGDGELHTGHLELDTLFGGIADDLQPMVRLSKGDPGAFALNTAVEASGVRWASVGFFFVVGIGLLGGCFGLLTYSVANQLRRVRRAAATGTPMLCPLVSRERVLNQGRPTGAELFRFQVPGSDGRETVAKYQCRTKGCPALTMAGDRFVLAIVPPQAPTQAILLLQNFYPFVFSEAQKLSAKAALEAAGRAVA